MVNQFIHLKTKSHYSILESSIKVDDLIDRAVEDNMPAIALTDTNNLFGAMEFTKKALEKKIKAHKDATDRLANKFHDAEEQRESWQRRVDLAGSSFRADIDAHLQQVRGSTTYI